MNIALSKKSEHIPNISCILAGLGWNSLLRLQYLLAVQGQDLAGPDRQWLLLSQPGP